MFRAPCALSKPSITATAPTKYQQVSSASQRTRATRRPILNYKKKQNSQLHRKHVKNASVAAGHLSSSRALRFRLLPSGAACHLLPIGALHCPTTFHHPAPRAISHHPAPRAALNHALPTRRRAPSLTSHHPA
eukprot:747865-Pleurochrysis_carterae.AAC.2